MGPALRMRAVCTNCSALTTKHTFDDTELCKWCQVETEFNNIYSLKPKIL